VLEFLTDWLESRRPGTAPISIRLVGQKSLSNAMMWAVDETGIVVTTEGDPETHVSLPWTSVFAVSINK
jgi:hypothetical protein